MEHPFCMAIVLCEINSSFVSRRQQNMKSDKIKNGKGFQSNNFALNAEPLLSQTDTAKRFFETYTLVCLLRNPRVLATKLMNKFV